MEEIIIAASCTFGMEVVLKREIIALGYNIYKVNDGKVYFKGTFEDMMKANLWLRSADRVLIYVSEFKAETFDELFDNIYDYKWEEILDKNAKFNVSKITSVKSHLFSKTDCQKIIKKAIAERLKKHYKVNILSETGSEYGLYVTINKDIVSVFINTSGIGLHKRGYRLEAGKAPIKETLAAGIILLSNYRSQQQFSDPMCGSGTFIIEAALIAKNKAPGLNRSFAFETWENINRNKFKNIKEDAKSKIIKAPLRLLGSDIDYRSLKKAMANAQNAGVADDTSFQKLDMKEFRSRKKCGIMVTNPPYGERMGEEKYLAELYKDLGNVYAGLNEWRLFLICAHPMFETYFGKKADKNRKLFNGDIQSYLYQYYPKRLSK